MARGRKMPTLNATPAVCRDCKYYHVQADLCGYCLDTGHSRTFKDGKQYLAKGKCDKYEQKTTRRRKTGDEVFHTTVQPYWKRNRNDD